jgi:RNA polymerase sigma factor (sigma-70 family)
MGSVSKFIRFPSKTRVLSHATDEDLIAQIQQDAPDAWAALLNRYTHFIYYKAYEYSQTGHRQKTPEDLEDEVVDLYLFMTGCLKNSLKSFQGKCKPKTWITSIIGNRTRIIKAYLLQKKPQRADVRLPGILVDRPPQDHEIFKRLIWGFDTAYIAQDLNISEDSCREIETLLAHNSPRVYERIRANRASRSPHLSIGADEDEENGSVLDIADSDLTPEESLENQEAQHIIQKAVLDCTQTLSPPERRILILLYNESLKPADIVDIVSSIPNCGLPSTLNLNRVYYLKDRALNTICDIIGRQFGQSTQDNKHNVIESLEAYLSECGFPTDRATVQD